MIEGKHVPKDYLVEWNQNIFITARTLAKSMVQGPGLLPPQPAMYNMGNWTRTVCSKPNLTLTYWSQGGNKEHKT